MSLSLAHLTCKILFLLIMHLFYGIVYPRTFALFNHFQFLNHASRLFYSQHSINDFITMYIAFRAHLFVDFTLNKNKFYYYYYY